MKSIIESGTHVLVNGSSGSGKSVFVEIASKACLAAEIQARSFVAGDQFRKQKAEAARKFRDGGGVFPGLKLILPQFEEFVREVNGLASDYGKCVGFSDGLLRGLDQIEDFNCLIARLDGRQEATPVANELPQVIMVVPPADAIARIKGRAIGEINGLVDRSNENYRQQNLFLGLLYAVVQNDDSLTKEYVAEIKGTRNLTLTDYLSESGLMSGIRDDDLLLSVRETRLSQYAKMKDGVYFPGDVAIALLSLGGYEFDKYNGVLTVEDGAKNRYAIRNGLNVSFDEFKLECRNVAQQIVFRQ